MGWQTVEQSDPPESMKGWKIHCFTCKKDVLTKATVHKLHLGHDVEWVNKKDGRRYV